jgi:adenylate kinase family enzyme
VETARKRLEVYKLHAGALVDYYSNCVAGGQPRSPRYIRISAAGSLQEVRGKLFSALDKHAILPTD